MWAIILLTFLTAVLISGLLFYHLIVGEESTNVWSILFGWQWFYLATASIVVLVISIVKKKPQLRGVVVPIIFSLAAVLLSAQYVYSSRLYITSEGGPAGPDMNCLIWDEPFISGAYSNNSFTLCTLMSMPSFNKFLIDQRLFADSTDSSATYYAMLFINEVVVIGSFILGFRKAKT